MSKFVPAGPARYAHQKQGLINMIKNRGVHALLFDPGCIYGDADIIVNRAGKSFHIALSELVRMIHGGGRGPRRDQVWDTSIPTKVQRREEDGTLRLVEITGAWASGVKQTYTVTTVSGRTIRATDEHPFLTDTGWKRLDQLRTTDSVMVCGDQASGKDREDKPRYRERAGLRHHPYAYKRDAATSPYRVAEHRLIVEAHRSGLSLSHYLAILRTGATPPKPLLFLTPKNVVHHIDGDSKNNALSNLEVLKDQGEHNRTHKVETRILFKSKLEQIVSIEPYGREETYDIEVAGDPHNFVADGFVVHNTGKTAVALDYASLLAMKSPTGEARVLVIAPLAAVDTWVSQSMLYVHSDVSVWAEALGGSIRQRGETLAIRGENPFPRSTVKPYKHETPRAAQNKRSHALAVRGGHNHPYEGPNALPAPRLVLCAVNLDAFSSRAPVKQGSSKLLSDFMVDAVKRFAPDLIVIDESHRIKSASSNVSRTMARLSKVCRRRVILTGTVLPHSPLDIYGQWRFLQPDAFGTKMADGTTRPASFGTFRSRFAKMGGWMGKEVKGFKNLDEMQDVMALNCTVAKKEDALDLPATTDVIVPVHLSPAERKAYDDMKKALSTMLAGGSLASVPNRLTQIMRLRQITSGFIKDDIGVIQDIGQSKVKVIKSIVEDTLAGETRIVVFAHFRHELDSLEKALTKSGTEVVKITGATSNEDRTLIRKKFGSDDPQRIVMLAQVKTMSLAVNELVTASHAIFASLSQQRDDFVQSRDRLDRIGQTKPVTFWYALSPGSIDEVIMQAHRDRTSLEDAMLKHISE